MGKKKIKNSIFANASKASPTLFGVHRLIDGFRFLTVSCGFLFFFFFFRDDRKTEERENKATEGTHEVNSVSRNRRGGFCAAEYDKSRYKAYPEGEGVDGGA